MSRLPNQYGLLGLALQYYLEQLNCVTGIEMPWVDYASLRKEAFILHRSSEASCSGLDVTEDGEAWMTTSYGATYRVANNLPGAISRIEAICEKHNLCFYYQEDPRGLSLYLDSQPLSRVNYSNKHAVPLTLTASDCKEVIKLL